MKLGIYIAHWKRLDLFRVVLKNWRAVEAELGADFAIAVAGPSSKQDRRLCEEFRCRYVATANSPLGAKWNSAVQLLKDCDVLCVTGSDDLLSAPAISSLMGAMETHEMAGFLDLYLYAPATTSLLYWPGYGAPRKGETIGPGRMLSHRLMDALDWQPVEAGLERDLDRSMFQRLAPLDYELATFTSSTRGSAGVVVDVKTKVNINSMARFREHARGYREVAYPSRMLAQHFGPDMFDALSEVNP